MIIIMLFLLTDSPQKLNLKKVNGTLLIIFYVGPSSPQPQRIPFLLKTHTKKHSSASGWW